MKNPKNNQENARRKIEIGKEVRSEKEEFSTNFIKTSKYNMWNFIPMCLFL